MKYPRPKKHLGQNFLHDRRVLEKILHAAKLSPRDTVIEIGPGRGVLTVKLAGLAGTVIALEQDIDLLPALREKLATYKNVTLLHKDVLQYDEHPKNGAYKLVANIPYYITSPILSHFLQDTVCRPSLCVLLVQKEVANKICSIPPDMNVLALNVQTFGRPKIINYVSKKAFNPAPKVDSAVLSIDVYKKPAVVCDIDRYFRLIHAGFSQKRKTLGNSIKQLGGVALLEKAGIDPKRRAETLSIKEWEMLANVS